MCRCIASKLWSIVTTYRDIAWKFRGTTAKLRSIGSMDRAHEGGRSSNSRKRTRLLTTVANVMTMFSSGTSNT